MCTLVYAELGLSTSQLRFACAGLWEGRSTPLYAYGPGELRDEAVESLRPGTTVLLNSDGLVERRSQPLDEGMEHLRSTVGAHRSAAVSTVLGFLLRELPDPEHGDDMCALVARLRPGEGPD